MGTLKLRGGEFHVAFQADFEHSFLLAGQGCSDDVIDIFVDSNADH